jgi:hypothetical protein
MPFFAKLAEKLTPPARRKARSAPLKNEAAAGRLREICAAAESEAIARLGSRAAGLSADEVGERLKEYGPNTLAGPKKHRVLADLFERLVNPLVIQLLIICTISFLMGDLKSTAVVGSMILLSVMLAYVQERRSGRAAEKLQSLIRASAVVVRTGREIEIPLAEIVPGDIIVLAAGSIIPASPPSPANRCRPRRARPRPDPWPSTRWISRTPSSRAAPWSAARAGRSRSTPGWTRSWARSRSTSPPARRTRASTGASGPSSGS